METLSKAVCGVCITISLFFDGAVHGAARWPEVRSLHETRAFDDVDKAGLELAIAGRDQRPLYQLKCHSGLYEGGSDFNYSGLLDCRLVSLYSIESVSSLLTDDVDQRNDWSDRGRFLAEHLRKGCIGYPDWGGTRVFHLRGMEIAIQITNVLYGESAVSANLVRSYSVTVDVKGDKNALNSLSAKPAAGMPSWFSRPAEKCSEYPLRICSSKSGIEY